MGSISLPTLAIVAAATSAAAGGASAYEAREQGIATSKMDRQKARVEADQEKQKQINMRQNMLRALASQNAAGLGTSPSRANTMRQITQAQNDLMVSQANSSAQVSLLDQAATNASQAGSVAAAGDVIGTAGSFMGSPGGKAALT